MKVLSKKYMLIGVLIGITPLVYFIFTGFNINEEKIRDPLSYSIYFYVILPFSFFFLIVCTISGALFGDKSFTKPIKTVVIIAVFLALIISLSMFIIDIIPFSELFPYSFVLLVIISPFLLILALIIGRN